VACSENALVVAVNLANSTSAANTVVLAGGCTYALTLPRGGLANGLPVITTPIEMIGPATVTRSSLLVFRIAEVSSTGSLTLTTSIAFTNGSAVGDGGGILNRGAVTLTNSSLSGNLATLNGVAWRTPIRLLAPRPPRRSPAVQSPGTVRCLVAAVSTTVCVGH
jgi:hypothetical protein